MCIVFLCIYSDTVNEIVDNFTKRKLQIQLRFSTKNNYKFWFYPISTFMLLIHTLSSAINYAHH